MRYCWIILLSACCLMDAKANSIAPAKASNSAFKSIEKVYSVPLDTAALLLTLTPKKIYQLTGKKLSLQEKLLLKLHQRAIKKSAKAKANKAPGNKGKTSFTLGLIALLGLLVPGVGLLSLPLAILAIIFGSQAKKENPNDRNARKGITLGLVTIGILVFLAGLIVLILAAWN